MGVLGESGELAETSWAGRGDAPEMVLHLESNGRGSLGGILREGAKKGFGWILAGSWRRFWGRPPVGSWPESEGPAGGLGQWGRVPAGGSTTFPPTHRHPRPS